MSPSRRTGQQVTCTLRHQDGSSEQLRARYLAGCDGARSSVRRLAGIPFEGGSYPQTFALGDLEVDGDLERDAAHAFVGAPGMLFFFPLGRPASWRMLGMRPTVPGAAEHEEPRPPSLADLQAIADAFTGGRLRLRDPVWLTYFRLHHRHAARYRAGRVFLAGDAAHVHSPAGAQGMNTGIQDAWNLGWKLALVDRGLADEALLDSYEAERWPIGRFVLRFTDRATAIATSDSPVLRLIRTQVAPRLAPARAALSRARAYGFRTLSQLAHPLPRQPGRRRGRARAPPRAEGRGSAPRRPHRRPRTRALAAGSTRHADATTSCCADPPTSWNSEQLAALGERYAGLVAVHRLAREAGSRRPPRRPTERPSPGSASSRRPSTSCGPTATSATAAAAPTWAASSATSPAGSPSGTHDCVVSVSNRARTQNGHIRNDTRDVSRRIAPAATARFAGESVSRVIASARA